MDAYERQLRRALRWYPRHYRESRGEEIVATALELRAPGAQEVDRAELRGLALAGLRTRVREHPPLRAWAAYRFLGARVPYRYRMWARDDVVGRWFAVRRFGWGLAALVVVMAACLPLAYGGALYAGLDPWGDDYTVGLAPKVVESLLAAGSLWLVFWVTAQFVTRFDRDSVLARHGFAPEAEPPAGVSERHG
ncbi:hypothetical protein ACQEU5_19425 [Marinactinospora thermotolerans]|uniref:Uncharacterized protein n=1 Tax=Marinactinospora thermotolerans DSM 45154 TaxID=1122192 RepID=A0A1T4NMI2_9ACTN|nr:hypothetical protein [Marinactinospora thermotolerans]SJZ80315.1 hypothetical protein SAMN02745673_01506 [Marinactinospora thermotolerans DSM 45154]